MGPKTSSGRRGEESPFPLPEDARCPSTHHHGRSSPRRSRKRPHRDARFSEARRWPSPLTSALLEGPPAAYGLAPTSHELPIEAPTAARAGRWLQPLSRGTETSQRTRSIGTHSRRGLSAARWRIFPLTKSLVPNRDITAATTSGNEARGDISFGTNVSLRMAS